MKLATLQLRIRDRLSPEWLTPSQLDVWNKLHRFDGPPHRVVNVYGPRGSGKSFLGWLMDREHYATYGVWSARPAPVYSRLVLDNAPPTRAQARDVRPWVDELSIQQIILLSRQRVDEPDMPAFELTVSRDDIEYLSGNLYRHLGIIIPESEEYSDYHQAIQSYLKREQDGRV